MKKKSLLARIRYWFDCMMSTGPIAMSLFLFSVTAALVIVIGVLAYFASDDGSIFYQIWNSLLYTLDAGNLAGVSTDNILYLLLMFLATLCGLFLTSVLIGIISTGVEGKLRDLRKGVSVVQEEGHTVIVGFDNNIYSILRELIEANSNQKNPCIVVLGRRSKEEMEESIASHIIDTQNTRIICRSGNLHEAYALERCSVETAKSVILNVEDDAEIVKILLALSAYLKDKKLLYPNLHFVASMEENQYVEAARIAGEGRALIIYAKDAIARIIANTCRQHGLSQVLTELFNFTGNEMYFEKIPELTGCTFRDAISRFSNAVVVGLVLENGDMKLNPPMETVIGAADKVVLLEADDGDYLLHRGKPADESKICNGASISAEASNHLIVLGSNDKLPIVLMEYDQYVQPDTKVLIVDEDVADGVYREYKNLHIANCTEPISRELLCSFLDEHANNILLLNDDSQNSEASDSQTLLRLILLRDIADKTGRQFAITTEMRSIDNQRLAARARVDDFVIGSNFASLLMAQISENPEMLSLIEELLDERGSELYMKPAEEYVKLGEPVDSYTIAESAARKGEVFVGYRCISTGQKNVIVNPVKEEIITFGKGDQIVVISEN